MSEHSWLIIPGGDTPDGICHAGSWFCTRCWAKVPRPYLQGGEPPPILGPCFDRQPGQHRWLQSWPGNVCLDCGLEDPMEGPDALVSCLKCGFPVTPEDYKRLAEAPCEECAGTGAVVNPNLVIPPCPYTLGSAPTAVK